MDGICVSSDVGPQSGVQPVSAMPTGRSEGDVTGAPVRVTDGLIDAILARLVTVPPERGGALLTAGGLVHLLVEDSSARYSQTSWDISTALSATVGEIEAAGHGTLAGLVHTHPPGIPEPSSTDIATTRDALGLNPHLGELLIAIVTEGTPREHDLPVGPRHRMSLHVLRRNHTGQPSPAPVRGAVVPLTPISPPLHHDHLGHQHHLMAPDEARQDGTAADRVAHRHHAQPLPGSPSRYARPGPPRCSSTRATRRSARSQ